MPRIWLARLTLLIALFVIGWGGGSILQSSRRHDWSPRSGKLRVLTTIFPLYDFARQIGGDAVEVRNLLPPGVDPHEYALSPSDAALVSHADVIVANGLGLDDFLAEALSKADAAGRQPLYCASGLSALHSDDHQGDDEHDHSRGDPHMWLDPVLAREYVKKLSAEIRSALERRGRVDQAGEVRRRSAEYERDLADLNVEYQRELAPVARKPFIAFHSAYGYMAARYDLRMAAVWEPSPGRQPGPREVAMLIDLAHRNKVSVFFSEPGFSSRAVEMIAADARLSVVPLDPLETATRFDTTHYVEKMRANLSTLVHALR